MATKIATKTFYFNATKDKVVEEGDESAAFLLVRKGSPVDPEVAAHYGIPTEDGGDLRTPMPGANVGGSATVEAQRAVTQATQRLNDEMRATVDAGTDAALSRQRAGMLEGKVSGEAAASSANSTGQPVPASAAAAAVLDHQRQSMSGSDLFAGAGAAKASGSGEEGRAFESGEANQEAGANPTPSEMKQAEKTAAASSRSATVDAPADAGGKSGDNLQAGTQEYTQGVGRAITPEGTERIDKTQPAPGAQPLPDNVSVPAAGVAPASTAPKPLPAQPLPPPSQAPALDNTLGDALQAEGVTTGDDGGKAPSGI